MRLQFYKTPESSGAAIFHDRQIRQFAIRHSPFAEQTTRVTVATLQTSTRVTVATWRRCSRRRTWCLTTDIVWVRTRVGKVTYVTFQHPRVSRCDGDGIRVAAAGGRSPRVAARRLSFLRAGKSDTCHFSTPQSQSTRRLFSYARMKKSRLRSRDGQSWMPTRASFSSRRSPARSVVSRSRAAAYAGVARYTTRAAALRAFRARRCARMVARCSTAYCCT